MRHWNIILEADNRLRNLERAYQSQPTPETLKDLHRHLQRLGRDRDAAHLMAGHHAQRYRAAHNKYTEAHKKAFEGPGSYTSETHAQLAHLSTERDRAEANLRIHAKQAKQPPGHYLHRLPDESEEDHLAHLASVSGSVTRRNPMFSTKESAANYANSLKKHYPGYGTHVTSHDHYSYSVDHRKPNE